MKVISTTVWDAVVVRLLTAGIISSSRESGILHSVVLITTDQGQTLLTPTKTEAKSKA